MKNYRECKLQLIGTSRDCVLTMTGMTNVGVRAQLLEFGLVSTYTAYIVDEDDVEIGDHYNKVASYVDWLRIYDDKELSASFTADHINVYRAGDAGCIIQLINK